MFQCNSKHTFENEKHESHPITTNKTILSLPFHHQNLSVPCLQTLLSIIFFKKDIFIAQNSYGLTSKSLHWKLVFFFIPKALTHKICSIEPFITCLNSLFLTFLLSSHCVRHWVLNVFVSQSSYVQGLIPSMPMVLGRGRPLRDEVMSWGWGRWSPMMRLVPYKRDQRVLLYSISPYPEHKVALESGLPKNLTILALWSQTSDSRKVRNKYILRNGVFPAMSVNNGVTVISDSYPLGHSGKRRIPVWSGSYQAAATPYSEHWGTQDVKNTR